MKVTFFGTYNLKTTQRVQVLIDGLQANGIAVNECNVPLKVNTASRVAILKQPWRLPLFGLQILSCWIRLVIKRYRTPTSDFVIVGYMGQFDVLLARMLYPGKTIALDYLVSGAATARDRKVGGGFKDKLLIWLDNAALNAADWVIVDTEEHKQDIPETQRNKAVIIAVGAPDGWFSVTPKDTSKTLSLIFFGLYTPLQGTKTIADALTKIKDSLEVTMVGSGQDYEAARAIADKATKASITWKDWVDGEDLPQLTASHDVCLGIFGDGPKATKVVPNKVFQGAATGCAVITSDTPPQRRMLENIALLVPANDATALAVAIDSLSKDRKLLLSLRKASRSNALKNFQPQKIVRPLVPLIKH